MGFWIILCNFLSITKNSYSSRPLTRHHSYIWFGKFPVTLFLVYSVPIFTLWINDLCLTHFDRLLNRCTDLLQIWCWCFFGGPLPDLFNWLSPTIRYNVVPRDCFHCCAPDVSRKSPKSRRHSQSHYRSIK